MAKRLFTNNAKGTLQVAITSSSTVLTLGPGQGARFASPSGGDWQDVTLDDGVNVEICHLIARSGDTLTISRGYEGTLPVGFGAGARVQARFTADAATLSQSGVGGVPSREPVDWVDLSGQGYSDGAISVAGAPFNGASNVSVGQSVLVAYPPAGADCGIFTITSVDGGGNTATVTRRADSLAGSKLYAGEAIYCVKAAAIYFATDAYEGPNAVPYITIAGSLTSYVEWAPFDQVLLSRSKVLARRGFGVGYTSMNSSNTVYPSTGFVYYDATYQSGTVTLSSAASLVDANGFSYSQTVAIKRTDGSTNTLTVAVPTGHYLNNVPNGTTTIPANGSAVFRSAAPNLWFSTVG